MAKKKQESGPGPFMILTLVFFILASLILGVTTYMGYKGQEDLENSTKAAKEEKNKAVAVAEEEQARRIILRTAMGLEDPTDRQNLAGLAKAQAAAILDEHKRLTDKLGTSLPKGEFKWDLVADLEKGGDGSSNPSPAPKNTLPGIVKLHAKTAADWKGKFDAEKSARQTAEANAKAAQDQRDNDKKTFDGQVAKLGTDVQNKIADMQKAFDGLKTVADQRGAEFRKQAEEWAEARNKLEETVTGKNNDITSLLAKLRRAENPDPSDIDFKFKNWNPAKMQERMGVVFDKQGSFVNLQFSSNKMILVAGQTFVVIPSNRSLVEVLEREKELEKHHHTHVSLGPRDAFADNELIKGMVEITDAQTSTTARARITYEAQPIRNPIAKGDQLFNMSLSTGEKEHVAFAGIIDLDGDGRPDNEQFIRILERNNLVVDSYLDLKSGEIKGKKMTTATRFLIIGSDAPSVGNLRKMVADAKDLGVQQIDARLFLNLIGVKPPRNPAPPAYTSVNLGTDSAPPAKEGEVPMPPAVPDPKK